MLGGACEQERRQARAHVSARQSERPCVHAAGSVSARIAPSLAAAPRGLTAPGLVVHDSQPHRVRLVLNEIQLLRVCLLQPGVLRDVPDRSDKKGARSMRLNN